MDTLKKNWRAIVVTLIIAIAGYFGINLIVAPSDAPPATQAVEAPN